MIDGASAIGHSTSVVPIMAVGQIVNGQDATEWRILVYRYGICADEL